MIAWCKDKPYSVWGQHQTGQIADGFVCRLAVLYLKSRDLPRLAGLNGGSLNLPTTSTTPL